MYREKPKNLELYINYILKMGTFVKMEKMDINLK